jgi:prepilin-type processing-associated H-X9-DG protein
VQIWPFIEEQALYDAFDHSKASRDDVNSNRATRAIHGESIVAQPLNWLICPSDSEAPNAEGIFPTDQKQDGGGTNPPVRSPTAFVMGLWYPVSSGPTHFDGCPFCASPFPNECCQGASLGSSPAPPGNPGGVRPGMIPSFAGLFGRFAEYGLRLKDITDGTTHVIMAGETISAHCKYSCAHCPNFPFAMTNTPINKFVRTPLVLAAGTCSIGGGIGGASNPDDGGYCEACGYKSYHPGGAQFVMADGSTHFIREDIDFDVYALLGARASGEEKRLE